MHQPLITTPEEIKSNVSIKGFLSTTQNYYYVVAVIVMKYDAQRNEVMILIVIDF